MYVSGSEFGRNFSFVCFLSPLHTIQHELDITKSSADQDITDNTENLMPHTPAFPLP